ncbi:MULTISPECIES: UDP-N-acetylglucosamine 2-epimerase [Thalassotalea]|uniref:UDP-N-acetylglucosamine 2-epimerase n=1 Tax=Thalassotalea TaxID=1518149 RepID=UPI0009426038|nr:MULTISPECIES: UDP-N-acetylglucosamine 2-epimerase [Thalassotalea]OKY24698.1 UDP-N-acetyl-D-glucosamine 2-epimerase, UDP-hydrolysing [Thalassotalea sp. PP2-459]
MKKIAVFTGTRAEYGLLYLTLKGLQQSDDVALQLFVGGTHLAHNFGYTIKHIINDGFTVTEKMDFLLNSDTPVAVNKSMALAQMAAGECFDRHQPDLLVLLGDRFEALAVASAATIAGIPIAHIHGGELTEAAMDDAFRHAITKMAHLHFTSTEVYRQRVIQLGEQPENVLNVGAPGIDNIKQLPLLSKSELSDTLSIDLSKPYFLVGYHPETLSNQDAKIGLLCLLAALDQFETFSVVITYPNADTFGRAIITELENYARLHPERVHLFESIGQLNFLSAMKHAVALVGNSSSGIIETPSFNIPTVNIGDRQKGRLASKSVIHCKTNKHDITAAIQKAISPEFNASIANEPNPYGNGEASCKIVETLITRDITTRAKSFFDIT